MHEMQATPESSKVAEIGYDRAAREVIVKFLRDGTHVYFNVPEDVWEQFRNAPSKGAFAHIILKPGYSSRRVGF